MILELRHRLRRAHARHHVFALRVDQKFSVKNFSPVAGIARKSDAGTGIIAGVAVNHRLHIDRGSPFGGNVVFAAIHNRAVVHP